MPGVPVDFGRASRFQAHRTRPGTVRVTCLDGVVTRRPFPPTLMVVTSIISVQVGATVAKGLFGQIGPTSMVWLRLVTSALIFLLVARPVVTGRDARAWRAALGLGLCLTTMNWCIYQAFARIPLGMAVTIEFLGPLTVAAVMSRRRRDLLWVLLAGLGVGLLGFSPHGLTWSGIAFALVAGVAWAGYIIFTGHTGREWPGLTGLTVASLFGALLLAPPAVLEGGAGLWQPHILLIGASVGLLSSVIPYGLELIALRTMQPRVFGVLMSLEPAAAAIAALILLSEALTSLQWSAIGCVVAASAGVTLTGSEPSGPEPPVA